mgnify:CR=1 FL=1
MILVTGANGFLAQNFLLDCCNYCEPKIRIASSGNFIQPTRSYSTNLVENIIEGVDYFSSDSLNMLCEEVETIVHFAGIDSNTNLKLDEFLRVNCLITENLLNAAISSGVSNFIFLSTSQVYGSPLIGNIIESKLVHPNNYYAISKLCAEQLVHSAALKSKLCTVTVRVSNVVGAPLIHAPKKIRPLFEDLVIQGLLNKEISIRGPMKFQLNFITMSDFLLNLRKILGGINSDFPNVVNLGGKTLSLESVSFMVQEIFENIYGKKPNINFIHQNKNYINEFEYSSILKLKITNDFNKEISNICNFYYTKEIIDEKI